MQIRCIQHAIFKKDNSEMMDLQFGVNLAGFRHVSHINEIMTMNNSYYKGIKATLFAILIHFWQIISMQAITAFYSLYVLNRIFIG